MHPRTLVYIFIFPVGLALGLALLPVAAIGQEADAESTGEQSQGEIIEQLRQEQQHLQALLDDLQRQIQALQEGKTVPEETMPPPEEEGPSLEELLSPEIPQESEGIQSATTVGALAFNPDMGVVGEFVGSFGDKVPELGTGRHDTINRHVGVALSQRISPEAKAVAKFCYGTHLEMPVKSSAVSAQHDEDEAGGIWHSGLELEEAYVQFDNAWPSIQLRLGRERVPTMLFNQLDGHELPFVTRPLGIARMFGNHGLAEDGGRLSFLLPTSQYMNLDLGVYNSRNDMAFDGGASGDRLWMSRLNGYSDWNEGSDELSWGLGYLRGPNDEHGHKTDIASVDVHYQHLNDQFNRSFVDAGWLQADVKHNGGSFTRDGYFVHLAKRWDRYRRNQVGLLWENSEGLHHDHRDPINMLSLYYTWHRTGRVLLRLQWSHADFEHRSDADMFYFQTSWVMGTHPPHD